MARLTWQHATVVGIHQETTTARTLTLDVDGWLGHRPGQHVDVRLTADDGYTAVRPYSVATPRDGTLIDLTVELTEGGEVSSYLVADAALGTEMEVRGPLGGWFVWDPGDSAPVQLIGGGVGVAPLMAMLREHDRQVERHPMRLIYVTRDPGRLLYAKELVQRAEAVDPTSTITIVYTRHAPDSSARPPGRLTASDITVYGLPALSRTRCYVCGPTAFVEASIGLLEAAGFSGTDIRAERFG